MNANHYARLSSEINALRELLSEIPEENVIDRMGLEYRLEDAIKKLELSNPYHINKTAKLTFRGNPVIGSEGISASFAAKATSLFTESVAAIAASLTGALHFRGPIPDKQLNQLMITGTAIGSFGFEFELPRLDASDLCPEPSIVEKAVNGVRELFQVAATGTDDDLSNIVDEIQPRAVKKTHEFLCFLSEQDAWCGLEFDNHFFKFSSRSQLEKATERLNDNNIHEVDVYFDGKFDGLLPSIRSFDFKTIDNELIKGKVSKEILNIQEINEKMLFKHVTVKLKVTRIGESAPKYKLESLSDVILKAN